MQKEEQYKRAYQSLEEHLRSEKLRGEAALEAFVQMTHKDAPSGLPHFWWCGIYKLQGKGIKRELVLAAGSSPACTPLPVMPRLGGVCSDCALIEKPIVVSDVTTYPGHVSCHPEARSEIVVPLFMDEGQLIGVIDVDSNQPDCFNWIDAAWISRIADLLSTRI